MIRLIYVSQQAKALSEIEINELLVKAREHNLSHQLTGLLISAGKHFLQELEGPAAEVTALYQRIEQDPRHVNVTLVHKGPIAYRRFPSWSMSYQLLDQLEHSMIESYLKILSLESDDVAKAKINPIYQSLKMRLSE